MCIFCKIVSKDFPTYEIYEDAKTLAFLDIKPVNPGHTLVIPKKHYANIEEVEAEDLCALILTVKKIARLLKEKLGVPDYNILENNGPIAGQNVPHLHFHIIPRHEGDPRILWPQSEYAPGQAEEILNKLLN